MWIPMNCGELALGFVTTLLTVFFKVTQQQNVVHGRKGLAVCTSFIMAALDVALVGLVVKNGWTMFAPAGCGAALGVWGSMCIHPRLFAQHTRGATAAPAPKQCWECKAIEPQPHKPGCAYGVAPCGEPLPPLPEAKVMVREADEEVRSLENGGWIVDCDCEGPLSYSLEGGEALYTADQMREYAQAARGVALPDGAKNG